MEVVIPPKSNRIEQRKYDKALYKLRHLVKKMLFCISSAGEALLRAMPKTPHPFSLQYKYDALIYWVK